MTVDKGFIKARREAKRAVGAVAQKVAVFGKYHQGYEEVETLDKVTEKLKEIEVLLNGKG